MQRADLQAGVVASVVANVNRDRKKRKKPFEPQDFVLNFERKRAKSPEELMEKVKHITGLLGHKLTSKDTAWPH